MKTYTDYLILNTRERKEIVNITEQVGTAVAKSGHMFLTIDLIKYDECRLVPLKHQKDIYELSNCY